MVSDSATVCQGDLAVVLGDFALEFVAVAVAVAAVAADILLIIVPKASGRTGLPCRAAVAVDDEGACS